MHKIVVPLSMVGLLATGALMGASSSKLMPAVCPPAHMYPHVASTSPTLHVSSQPDSPRDGEDVSPGAAAASVPSPVPTSSSSSSSSSARTLGSSLDSEVGLGSSSSSSSSSSSAAAEARWELASLGRAYTKMSEEYPLASTMLSTGLVATGAVVVARKTHPLISVGAAALGGGYWLYSKQLDVKKAMAGYALLQEACKGKDEAAQLALFKTIMSKAIVRDEAARSLAPVLDKYAYTSMDRGDSKEQR